MDDQKRFICFCDNNQYYSLASTYVVAPNQQLNLDLRYVACVLNSKLVAFFNTQHFSGVKVTRTEVLKVPIRIIEFTTPCGIRTDLRVKGQRLYSTCIDRGDQAHVIGFVEHQLSQELERADVVHDLLVHLAQQLMDLHKESYRLEGEADLFQFLDRTMPCSPLNNALGGALNAGEMIRQQEDPPSVYHDIEGLRLGQEADGRWLLEVRAKLRDPKTGWREHQRDVDGNLVRQWLPVYRLPLDEATGRFYQYAFARLNGFDGAGKFPGGSGRTLLEKLHATQIPKFVPVDLAPLAALEAELADVHRKIQLTDDLIDQIVYRLYGLTEEEIAIVEGRA